MPPSRRTNLGRRTRNTASQRYIRANQIDEQREARNEVLATIFITYERLNRFGFKLVKR